MTEETITINNVEYVRADSVVKKATPNAEGLRYAIVRSRDQGVICGFIESIEGQTVVVINARQMSRWSSRFVLLDVAEHGLTERWERKFSCEMSEPLVMTEACGILYCTDIAKDSLRNERAQDHTNE